MQEEKFENYFNEIITKRYEDAKFYLNILIESGIINKSDDKIKELFIKWFSNTKEFDLQIKDGDFSIENGDIKIVPDFKKSDILDFVNWYNNEKDDFIRYLDTNGISAQKQTKISEQKINAQNIIINNGKINSISQKTTLSKKRKRWSIIGIISITIATLTFIFGDNIYQKLKGNNPKVEYDSLLDGNDFFYLHNNTHPIVDKGLFVKQNSDSLIFGGVNFSFVKSVGARTGDGEKIDIGKDSNGNLIFNISKDPYIEFSYRDELYSLEVREHRNSERYNVSLQKILVATLTLMEVNK